MAGAVGVAERKQQGSAAAIGAVQQVDGGGFRVDGERCGGRIGTLARDNEAGGSLRRVDHIEGDALKFLMAGGKIDEVHLKLV